MPRAPATRLMTPAFASPEQVRGEAVTTATDVYSLGLLLYEVLTGSKAQEVEDLSPAELERRICETEPERPAPRRGPVTTRRRGPSGAAASPPTGWPPAPGRPRHHPVDGDAERSRRRYASAAALADDLERHLTGRPVRARRDTVGYRASKFVRRHRLGVAVAAMAVAALAAGLVLALLGFVRAPARRDGGARRGGDGAAGVGVPGRAVQDQRTRGGTRQHGDGPRAPRPRRERIEEQLAGQPAVRARLLRVMGRAYGELGLFEPEVKALERELQAQVAMHGPESPEAAATLSVLAKAQLDKGSYETARDLTQRALAIQERTIGPEHIDLAHTLSQLGIAHWYLGDLGEARRVLERSLAIQEKLLERTTATWEGFSTTWPSCTTTRETRMPRGLFSSAVWPSSARARSRSPERGAQPQQPGARPSPGRRSRASAVPPRARPGLAPQAPGARSPRDRREPQQPGGGAAHLGSAARGARGVHGRPGDPRAGAGGRAPVRRHDVGQPRPHLRRARRLRRRAADVRARNRDFHRGAGDRPLQPRLLSRRPRGPGPSGRRSRLGRTRLPPRPGSDGERPRPRSSGRPEVRRSYAALLRDLGREAEAAEQEQRAAAKPQS